MHGHMAQCLAPLAAKIVLLVASLACLLSPAASQKGMNTTVQEVPFFPNRTTINMCAQGAGDVRCCLRRCAGPRLSAARLQWHATQPLLLSPLLQLYGRIHAIHPLRRPATQRVQRL